MEKRICRCSIAIFALALMLCRLASADNLQIEVIRRAAETVVDPPFEIYFVPSASGPLANAVFRTVSKIGPSGVAQQLAQEFEKPRDKLRTIVIAGPSDKNTKQVLLDALKLVAGEPLTNLRLVFVGSSKIGLKLGPIVTATGAEFKIAPK